MAEEVEREDGGCTRKRGRIEGRVTGHGPAQSPLGSAFQSADSLSGFTFGSLHLVPSALSFRFLCHPLRRSFIGLPAMAHHRPRALCQDRAFKAHQCTVKH